MNYLIIIYAVSIPYYKHFTKEIGVLLLVLWIIDGNLKVKLRILLNSKVILFFILFILYNLVSLLWTYNLNSAYEY
ncbi:MAG: hypothetical protein KAJ49_10300, partial [Arcobacteraceae bacterium]|nr:hypothetical protein [Arcobacteraceae bacterium]